MASLLFTFIPTSHATPTPSSCISCHENIEPISKNHIIPCTSCHGGINTTNNKDAAHTDMIGKNNPSDPAVWDKTCGSCHDSQVRRVKSTIMLTNTGIIKNSIEAWGESENTLFTTGKTDQYDHQGLPISLKKIANLDSLSGELYRKFCAACHIGYQRDVGINSRHSSGCAACHFHYNQSGKYKGKDKAMQNKRGYPATHAMDKLPTDDACISCHNRSGRIGLNYYGLYDGSSSLIPTKEGFPGPELASGLRNLTHIKADIHKEFGMECIDCHTSREIMGDGYLYENMYMQLEITCEDCHGSPKSLPSTQFITKESDTPLIESKSYAVPVVYGQEMVLTSKKRMFTNVMKENNDFILTTKRTGKKLKIKTITNKPEHQIPGHKKMECYSCHSNTVIQCYGCHTTYDKRKKMMDLVKGVATPGAFSETEDMRILKPFPLAVNQRGKISPVTPGCQTFITQIDEEGKTITTEELPLFRNKKQYKFAPFYSHNTGKKAVTCKECHSTLAYAGFGAGLVSNQQKSITSATQCDQCDKPLDALYTMENGKIELLSGIVREKSRPLNKNEIDAMMKANLCIICHDKADTKYYGKTIDYNILKDAVHRPLLTD